jgi:PAS domain S-box-containing protein
VDGAAAFVNVPVTKLGQWVATFCVESAEPRSWTCDQVALIEIIADRTWSAGERARVECALSRRNERHAFMRDLNDAIREIAEPARILQEACRMLGTYLRVNRVSYGDIDGDNCTIVSDYVDGLPSLVGRFPWTEMGASRNEDILKGRTLFVNDTFAEVHTPPERAVLQAAGIGAYICPLLVKDGRFVASFGVHSREPRTWTAEEISLVEDVADRIWSMLEHRKAETELRTNEERLAFLLRLNDALRPLRDPNAVQETAARLLGEHLGVTRVIYAEIDAGQYTIHHEYAHAVPPLAGQSLQLLTNSPVRATLSRGETVIVTDRASDPRLTDGDRATMQARQVAAFVVTPLLKDGQMMATFGVNHATPRLWTAAEVRTVNDVAERTWEAVDRARAETALHEQRQRLRLALEASAGGSWTWTAATNQGDWDDRFRALYDFSPDEPATSDAWLTRVHEEDRARLLALREEMCSSPTADSWESTFRIVRPDGTISWIQSRGRVDRDADGHVTRLTGLDLDFDLQHRTEEARQARREEEHDRALRTLLETATQGIVSVDPQGMIVTANHAFATMFGWTATAVVGQPIEPLMPAVFPDQADRRQPTHATAVRRDGSTFPIEVSVNEVPSPVGRRAFAFVTDITERERAAAALLEHAAELEYRSRQLSRMASELTLAERHAREQIARNLHDGLQQMLVMAALNLEHQLKRDSEANATPSQLVVDAKYHLEEAVAAARTLNFELSPPVLQYAGLPTALTWLAGWTQDKYKLPVQVMADPRADSPRKDVRTLLFESVRELLFNAVKHARTDSVTLELGLAANSQLCITVSDRGVGFDPQVLNQRLETSGQSGWGLFSIRERLTLLGGHFEIDSAPGKGTRMHLVAPRGGTASSAVTHQDAADAVHPVSPADDGRVPADALRVLIVDDHVGVREALRTLLTELPQLAVVGDASNGLEAVARAQALRPDVILMDITMPHMDGVEATKRIRAERPDSHIFALSMQPRVGDAHAIEQAGATDFFVKGVDLQRLITRLLDLHTQRRSQS